VSSVGKTMTKLSPSLVKTKSRPQSGLVPTRESHSKAMGRLLDATNNTVSHAADVTKRPKVHRTRKRTKWPKLSNATKTSNSSKSSRPLKSLKPSKLSKPKKMLRPPKPSKPPKPPKPPKPSEASADQQSPCRVLWVSATSQSRHSANITDKMVPRERHPINKGRSVHFVGKIGKKYHHGDYAGPIIDSMAMMYARIGWTRRLTDAELDDCYPCCFQPVTRDPPKLLAPQSGLGTKTEPFQPPKSLCGNCEEAVSWNDFRATDDKSHLCCVRCGAISKPLHIATDRERNCNRDEDKTTHADRPYELDTDRFSKPAMLANERRRQTERDIAGTYVSKRAKDKYGIGFAMERNNRSAATDEMERSRNGMSNRDINKGHQVVVEIEKLFEPLEKMDHRVKRYCRMEADRLWREAVRHAAICCANGWCQYRLKEKPVSVIASTSLVCSLNNLAHGVDVIEGVQHGHIVTLNTKLRTTQQNTVSSGYRAVEQVVRRLAAHRGADPVPICPLPSATPSPAPSADSSRCGIPASVHPSPISSTSVALNSSDSFSDLDGTEDLLQLRDAIGKVQRHTSRAPRIQRAALRAIQDATFRAAAFSEGLGSFELAYCILDAVGVKLTGVSIPEAQRPGKLNIDRIASVMSRLVQVLPATIYDNDTTEEDGLF